MSPFNHNIYPTSKYKIKETKPDYIQGDFIYKVSPFRSLDVPSNEL